MIKVLAACGAGVNSSHQIKDAIESEFKNRGYNLHCDAVMIKDVNEEMLSQYDIFAQIAKTDLALRLSPRSSTPARFSIACLLWLSRFTTRLRPLSRKRVSINHLQLRSAQSLALRKMTTGNGIFLF